MQQQIPEELRTKIAQFQTLQQQLQLVAMQKQQLLLEKNDLDEASKEVEKSKGDLYKSVGPLLIKAPKTELKKELGEKTTSTSSRITLLEKQEQKLVMKVQELQKDLQAGLGGAEANQPAGG